MELTKQNYFSSEASWKYMGSTQLKDFMDCEERAMETLKGEYKLKTDAFLQGQYLDAYFEDGLEEFQMEHPEMFKIKGVGLLAKYEKVHTAIAVIENDPIMSKLCHGEQQRIFTGTICGVEFKVMIDSLHKDRIVDRKYMATFRDKWKKESYVAWWEEFRYDIQAAIYKEILRQNGIDLPFELVAISKDDVPDKAWVRFTDETLNNALEEVKFALPRIKAIKEGLIEPTACGNCDYCRSKKMLTEYEEV